MTEILDKMVANIYYVMATPAYFYSMDIQMKHRITRTNSRHTKIIDKEIYFIMSVADPRKEVLKGL
jgi:multimeric flavodoxin WrbA